MEVSKEIITLNIFSPLQKLENPLFNAKGVQVFIKRDDLIHPFISGNKWRKLKYTLQKAQSLHKSHLVTFGGAYSNHLVATACAAAKFGFRATAFVRGEEVKNQSLMLCRMFGMKLIFTDRESYKNKQELFGQNFKNDDNSYFIDEGGSCKEAVKGCSEVISELGQPFDHIFCAAGTGATAAGLLLGIDQASLPTLLHTVSSLKNGSFLKHEIGRYHEKTHNLLLHCDYHFGGYAKTTPELFSFLKQFASFTGILLDQVYTGKTAFAMFDMIRNDKFETGSKILLIHTGGLLGLFSQVDKF